MKSTFEIMNFRNLVFLCVTLLTCRCSAFVERSGSDTLPNAEGLVRVTNYTGDTSVNEVLETCWARNCSAACNQNNSDTWECCSCSLVVPPPPQPGGPTNLVTVHDFGGPLWRDELLATCQTRLCETVCSQGSGWYCCDRTGDCSTATVLRVTTNTANSAINEVLEDCSSSNCGAACSEDNGETWDCCSCSLVVPPPPQPGGPSRIITVHGFGGPLWRDELLATCQTRLCEAVCAQGSGWYCCNRASDCSTAAISRVTRYTNPTVNEELTNCSRSVLNCDAVCSQDNEETWECCSCSLGPPIDLEDSNLYIFRSKGRGGLWLDEFLDTCQSRNCAAVCKQTGTQWYCCHDDGIGCPTEDIAC